MVADGSNGSLFPEHNSNDPTPPIRRGPAPSTLRAPDDDNPASRLSRQQIIQQIQAANPTASAEYLEQFENYSLMLYLERLNALTGPRSGQSYWVRQPETPAITCAQAA